MTPIIIVSHSDCIVLLESHVHYTLLSGCTLFLLLNHTQYNFHFAAESVFTKKCEKDRLLQLCTEKMGLSVKTIRRQLQQLRNQKEIQQNPFMAFKPTLSLLLKNRSTIGGTDSLEQRPPTFLANFLRTGEGWFRFCSLIGHLAPAVRPGS